MSKLPIQQLSQYSDQIVGYQSQLRANMSKNPITTRYTQGQNKFLFPAQFLLGKNHLIENKTQSSLDSQDDESDVSFEERLNCCHQKKIVYVMQKYFELKGLTEEKQSFGDQQSVKSAQTMKQIEERVFEDIARSYDKGEAQKIRLVIKFIRRNQSLTKIYYEVIKHTPAHLQTTIYFLLKHSVMVYLQSRQKLGSEQTKLTQIIIKQYLRGNGSKIYDQIVKDEKLHILYDSRHDLAIKSKFGEFLFLWMEGFFLAKEGYPCYGFNLVQKAPSARMGMLQNRKQGQKRKKVKKF